MKKSLLIIAILLISVSVNAETITWKSPPADHHEVEISKFVGWSEPWQGSPIWASEIIPSTDKSIDVDLEEGIYMITVTSCLEGVCMDPSEPVWIECVDYDTAYDIEVE